MCYFIATQGLLQEVFMLLENTPSHVFTVKYFQQIFVPLQPLLAKGLIAAFRTRYMIRGF